MTRLLALLIAFISPRVPRPVVAGMGRILDEGESRFVTRWPEPGHARLAAAIFITALTLACAGSVGVVAVAVPGPAIPRLAAMVASPAVAPGRNPLSVVPASPADAKPEAATTSPPVTTTAAVAAAPPPVEPVPPSARGALPIGKGMWIWMPERADGGDAEAIVGRAKANGLTHLYVRTGTLKDGFIGADFLNRLLPVAHANSIRVYGWDFPYLDHPGDDVNRALTAIRYTTPDGHRIDGFSADIESTHEGTNNDLEFVTAYVHWLRDNVGPNYPLIATVPNPTAAKIRAGYPYAQVVAPFDAIAPMVYWMNRDPAADVANAVTFLQQFNKPIFPIGQAYDGGSEGGPPGQPNREALIRFMQYADAAGAAGVSFWSYQHASQETWDAVRDAGEFRLDLGGENGAGLLPGMVRAYQTVLTGLGFPVEMDGVWGPATAQAVVAYQNAAHLAPTGRIDEATHDFLLRPVAAPIKPV